MILEAFETKGSNKGISDLDKVQETILQNRINIFIGLLELIYHQD